MGFCDCAPGESKELRVLFLFNKEPHIATLSDQVHLHGTRAQYGVCSGCSSESKRQVVPFVSAKIAV